MFQLRLPLPYVWHLHSKIKCPSYQIITQNIHFQEFISLLFKIKKNKPDWKIPFIFQYKLQSRARRVIRSHIPIILMLWIDLTFSSFQIMQSVWFDISVIKKIFELYSHDLSNIFLRMSSTLSYFTALSRVYNAQASALYNIYHLYRNWILFADDLKIIFHIEDCDFVQRQPEKVQSLCYNNKLLFNASKCELMSFKWNLSILKYDYYISNTLLWRPTFIKDLDLDIW